MLGLGKGGTVWEEDMSLGLGKGGYVRFKKRR